MSIDLPVTPSYPAARVVAEQLHCGFTFEPGPAALERIIDAAFWASLRREEGVAPTISLAWLPIEATTQPILLERPIPLDPHALSRLAPAVERPGIHLGVWKSEGQLSVWGATHALPPDCFVLEVVAPGLLVIKQPNTDESAKFTNVAVLEGDQVKILSSTAVAPPDSPPIIHSLLGTNDEPSLLVSLAVSMRKHGRGGSLLVVPHAEGPWRDSIVQPIPYPVHPVAIPFLQGVVDRVAGLTAVDGATIITATWDLLAFGAKISRRRNYPRIEQVLASELIAGAVPQVVHPTQLGGTRHLSAAQFAQDQRDAVVLVASQDGRFTVFAWSVLHEMVQAYRVETFLV